MVVVVSLSSSSIKLLSFVNSLQASISSPIEIDDDDDDDDGRPNDKAARVTDRSQNSVTHFTHTFYSISNQYVTNVTRTSLPLCLSLAPIISIGLFDRSITRKPFPLMEE